MSYSVVTTHANLLDTVDARTRLSGTNHMEILLFSLGSSETFGINVFKVREIAEAPALTRVPNLPAGLSGVISLRGYIIPVIRLAELMGCDTERPPEIMIVTEFSRHTQGFLVHDVDHIVRVDWELVRAAPPTLTGENDLVTAITELPDGRLVSILDVEQILANIFGTVEMPELEAIKNPNSPSVLFADDSPVARREIVEVLDQLGVQHIQVGDGAEAWKRLQSMASSAKNEGVPLKRRLSAILTDAEMPAMDGYLLTRKVKGDARFEGIPVIMHSSLSSEANRAMGRSAGVDAYVAKFDPVVLADTLRPLLQRAA